MSKKSRFRRTLDRQHGKRAKTLWQSERPHLYHIHWRLWTQLSREKSLLVICKILRLFVNTLTADDKYCLLNRDNLMHQIQMDLSQKRKTFSEFFSAFSKSTLNFEHFQNKDDPQSFCISKIAGSERRGQKNVLKVPFERNHGEETW